MHAAAFAWAGLRGDYRARRVTSAELPAQIAALRRPGVLGANLSLPHKEAALPLLDALSDAARRIGAVNTVIHRGGELFGENTDAPGLLHALRGAGLTAPSGAVVVLGAGGAARAAVDAALSGLGREVYVVNRTPARAEALAAAWSARPAASELASGSASGPGPQVRAATREALPWEEVGLVINASSAGLGAPEESPLPDFDFARLPESAGVYDMVYQPRETRLLRDARSAGRRGENGLGMLAHQARLAFTAWTGAQVPVEVFLNALEGQLGTPPERPGGGG